MLKKIIKYLYKARVFFFFILFGCATNPQSLDRVTRVNQDVYYGGVYLLAGSHNDIPQRFPNLYTSITKPDSRLPLELSSLLSHKTDSFTEVNLKGFKGELAPDDGVIMAFSFSSERIFTESVLLMGYEATNLRVFLSGAFILQSFQRNQTGGFNVQLLGSFPFSYSAIDLVQHGEKINDRAEKVILGEELGVLSSEFQEMLANLAPRVVPVTGLGATLQVRTITTDDKVHQFMDTQFDSSESEFSHWLAGEIGAQLASQIGMPIVPYAEDSSTRNLAVMMQSGEAFNIHLPQPDFVMDISIAGFSRRLARETTTEVVWVYGAYGTFRIIEAHTGIVRWEKDVRDGVLKRVTRSQVNIDHGAAEFSALLQLLSKVPTELKEDPDARRLLENFLR